MLAPLKVYLDLLEVLLLFMLWK